MRTLESGRKPRVIATEIPGILRFIERPDLASALGLPDDLLATPEPRIPIDRWYAFVEAATEASGDPFLGLHFGAKHAAYFRHNPGAIGLMLLSSDSLRVAVDRMLRYQRYWNEGENYEVTERGGRVVLRYRPWGPPRPAHVQVAEKVAAQILLITRFAAGSPMPAAISFTHAARAGSEEVGRVLRCEPAFAAAYNEIALPAEVLNARLPTADAPLFAVLDHQLAAQVGAAPTMSGKFIDQTRKAISDLLHREGMSIGDVAKAVGCSARTLQRRLLERNLSFRVVLEDVRRSHALALLERGAAVSELTMILGYTEQNSFYRSFKRWTGTTPEGWKSRVSKRQR